MMSKIFNRGTGQASGIDYLMSVKDASGRTRNPAAELIRGDIKITKQLIASNRYAQRYTSGVLSWSESPESITPEQVDEVIESFQKMVCGGIATDRINWAWVKHQDKGRLELHFVIPNVDLLTGKRFATYFDRVDRPLFRSWERLINATHGFTNPADPSRRREVAIKPYLPENKLEAIALINRRLSVVACLGQIKSRSDVLNELKSLGFEINRAGKDYISIKDKFNKKLRLRGAFFEDDFQWSAKFMDSPDNIADIGALQTEYNTQLEKRSRYTKARFKEPEDRFTEIKPMNFNVVKEILNEGTAAIDTSINPKHRAVANQELSRLAIATQSIADSINLFIGNARKLIQRLTNSDVRPRVN